MKVEFLLLGFYLEFSDFSRTGVCHQIKNTGDGYSDILIETVRSGNWNHYRNKICRNTGIWKLSVKRH